jgi:hypothetical protein
MGAFSSKPASLWDRFWHYVDAPEDGCWEWRGVRMRTGYGQLGSRIGGKRVTLYAHRLSWEIANKAPVPKGMFVMHQCDNKPCVRPDHLELGTPADNNREYRERLFRPVGRCLNGHDLATHGRPKPRGGGRDCRVCQAARMQEQRAVRHALGVRGMKYATKDLRDAYRDAMNAYVLQQPPGFLARALDGAG